MKFILIICFKRILCTDFYSNPNTNGDESNQEKDVILYNSVIPSINDMATDNQNVKYSQITIETRNMRDEFKRIFLEKVNDYLKEQGYEVFFCNACIDNCGIHKPKCIFNTENIEQEDKDNYKNICEDIKNAVDDLSESNSEGDCVSIEECKAILHYVNYFLNELFADFVNYSLGKNLKRKAKKG
ncbi:hypothetical protein COBT_003107 [Conglomerata obtusa]